MVNSTIICTYKSLYYSGDELIKTAIVNYDEKVRKEEAEDAEDAEEAEEAEELVEMVVIIAEECPKKRLGPAFTHQCPKL